MAERTAGSAEQVRQLFDAKAATWSAKYATGGRLNDRRSQFSAAVERQAAQGSRVLDLGCGTGDLARYLARAGFQVTGCDISAEMLDRAAQADSAAVLQWMRLDPGWRTLPFADGMFGVIVASSVLEYVEDPVEVLRECARVLEPGGALMCTVPDTRHPVRWLESLARTAARAAAVRGVVEHQPRLGSYLTYLQISQQRHSERWWHAAGRRAGLGVAAKTAGATGRSPLRLLSFVMPAGRASIS
jgi:ubiquinone/menaquinone biosynthesis C-methylase UbiE